MTPSFTVVAKDTFTKTHHMPFKPFTKAIPYMWIFLGLGKLIVPKFHRIEPRDTFIIMDGHYGQLVASRTTFCGIWALKYDLKFRAWGVRRGEFWIVGLAGKKPKLRVRIPEDR